MAILRIYNDIVEEPEKIFLRKELGADGTCYKDIQHFLRSIPDDDNEIDLRIHCRGGSCVEGWAIYDALRRSGKEISATVEGECSSMATIILLAAPADRRFAYRNIHMCLHNPAIEELEGIWGDRLTADVIDGIVDRLDSQAKVMREEQNRILDLYVERTGSDRDELQALMDEDIFINAERAIELGFINSTLEPTTAKRKSHKHNSISNSMAKPIRKRTSVQLRASVYQRLLAKAGIKRIEDLKMRAQVVTAADGSELTVEREDGDPQVGDVAYPSGTFILDDGSAITVEGDVITRIDYADAGEPQALSDDPEEIRTQIAELQAHLAELEPGEVVEEQTVEDLQEQVEELEQTIEEQTQEIEALRRGRISASDRAILARVNKAGGMEWLNSVMNMRSTFTPSNRRFVTQGEGKGASGETKTQKALRETRAAQAAKRAARRK